ncbi:SURF1 family cytochrome oxidase biogenesis protein [Azospirillum sp. TSO22-1]|uniref:SURF1 family protein n=1 Tax=Azospirillum sp. TSO22-1 TaxID=716789 RepID=UPI000D65569D|nr:SURF1 family cytochrome oxidase biogenesis protein [Azospirillum sp. TSO22-1]
MSGPARRFRPSLWATLFTVPAVLAMLGLGTWQVERLGWKEDLIRRVHARMGAAPVPLPATVADPDDLDLRPVTVTGRLLNDRALLMIARPRQGQMGYEVVTPLQRADGGPPVLVNRGWIPMDRKDARRDGSPGEVTLRGVARLPAPAGWMQPGNTPGAEVWVRLDPPAMAAALGLAAVAPVVVEALPGQSPGGPSGIEPRVDLPNNHLQYAITWYSLAATLLVIYVVFHLRRRSDP